MKIVQKGESSRANPRRGYHDHVVIIEYDKPDEWEDDRYRAGVREGIVAFLGGPKSWMWFRVEEETPRRLHIRYGYDSSG